MMTSSFYEFSTLQGLAFLCLSLATVFLSKWISYRKYPPGPIGLPIVGFLPFLEKEPHKHFLKLSKKYGENIISLRLGGKLAVILNEYEAAKEVLSHPLAQDRHENSFAHIKERGFFILNGPEWIEQRRFSVRATKELGLGTSQWEKMIEEEVNSFIEELCSYKGQPVSVTDDLNELTSSNIISLLIGRRLDKKAEKEKVQLLVKFNDEATGTGLSLPLTLIPKLRQMLVKLKIGTYHIQQKVLDSFSMFVKEEIQKHKDRLDNKDAEDFMDSYLLKMKEMQSKQAQHGFTEGNLEGNINNLFVGGSETIATSMDWLLRLMAVNQNVQVRVQEEIDEVLGRDGKISFLERMKLPYTMAVHMELQRYASIAPLSPERKAAADFEINGFLIPAGSQIIANLWALHHDPNYWEEPEKFKPERFLAEDNRTLLKNLPSFGPFSFGRRNCPGEAVAYTELLVFFVMVMQRFTILPPEGGEVSFDRATSFIAHLKPQPLRFIDRFE